MGQASADVKRVTTYVTASNAEDGVADAIERYVLPALRSAEFDYVRTPLRMRAATIPAKHAMSDRPLLPNM